MMKLNKTQISFIVLLLFSVIFISFVFYQVNKIDYFYGYDPLYHYQLSLDSISQGKVVNELNWTVNPTPVEYISIQRVEASIITILTGVSLINVYKYLGGFCILLMFIFLINGFNRRGQTLLLYSLPLLATYSMWRSLVTWPENLALLFLVILIYCMINNRLHLGLFMFLSLVLTHLPTALVGSLFFIPLVLKNYKLSKIKYYLLAFIVLVLPIIPYLIRKLYVYITEHFALSGSPEIYNLEINTSRYAFLNFRDYLSWMSAPIILFAVIGFFYIIISNKKNFRLRNIILGSAFFIILLLTQGFFRIFYIPYNRVLGDFIVISFITISVYLKEFSSFGKKVLILIIFTLLILSAVNLTSIHGNLEIPSNDFEAAGYLHNQSGIKVELGPSIQNLKVESTESDWKKINYLFSLNSTTFISSLRTEYPNDTIHLYFNSDDRNNLLMTNKELLNFIERNLSREYGQDSINIYKIEASH